MKPTLNGNYVSEIHGGTLIRNFEKRDRQWLVGWMRSILKQEESKMFFLEECNYCYDPAGGIRRIYNEGFSLHYVPAKSDALYKKFVAALDRKTWLRLARRNK